MFALHLNGEHFFTTRENCSYVIYLQLLRINEDHINVLPQKSKGQHFRVNEYQQVVVETAPKTFLFVYPLTQIRRDRVKVLIGPFFLMANGVRLQHCVVCCAQSFGGL